MSDTMSDTTVILRKIPVLKQIKYIIWTFIKIEKDDFENYYR